jgi:hypothetical protein
MSDDNIQVDTQVVEQLAAVADTLAGLLEQVSQKHENQSKDMDYFREDLSLVRDSIRHIAKVLLEGNGEKPLISRVAVLEEKAANLEEQFDKLELSMEGAKRTTELKKNIDKKGKYAVAAAIVSGFGLWGVEIIRWLGSS